jgi:hypothetical protein
MKYLFAGIHDAVARCHPLSICIIHITHLCEKKEIIMKPSLCILGIFIAALSVIFMGCLHEDNSLRNRLIAAEDELTAVRGELSTAETELGSIRKELGTTQGELRGAEERIDRFEGLLEECEEESFGALEIDHNGRSNIRHLYIVPKGTSGWGGQLLGAPIPVGTWRRFPLRPGTYKIKAVFFTGQELISERTIVRGKITELKYAVRA